MALGAGNAPTGNANLPIGACPPPLPPYSLAKIAKPAKKPRLPPHAVDNRHNHPLLDEMKLMAEVTICTFFVFYLQIVGVTPRYRNMRQMRRLLAFDNGLIWVTPDSRLFNELIE